MRSGRKRWTHVLRGTWKGIDVTYADYQYTVQEGRNSQTFRFSTMAVYAARPALGRAFGYHLAVSLRRGSGLAMTLATPLALVVALRSRAPMLVLAAAFSALYFVDFPVLAEILVARWDLFEPLLGDREWVEGLFAEMNVTRRVIAHTRPKNGPSPSVLRRSGFVHVGEVVDPEDGLVWRWEFRR